MDEEGFKKAHGRTAVPSQREHSELIPIQEKKYLSMMQLDAEIGTEFVGYDHLTFDSKVSALTTEDEIVDALSDGEQGTVIVEQTPFYATMGGQEADKGVIRTAEGEFVVEDMYPPCRNKGRTYRPCDKGYDQDR